MKDLRDLTHEGLLGVVDGMGERPYRAGQIYRWLYSHGVSSIDDMTDLSLGLRERLKDGYTIKSPTV